MKLLPVPPRSSGNYRLYPPESVERVRLIRHALTVGFSLPELAKILKVRDKDGAPCREVKRLLDEKLNAMNKQIRDLGAMRDHLRTVLDDWDKQLRKTPEGKPARLLETLVVPACLLPVKLKGNEYDCSKTNFYKIAKADRSVVSRISGICDSSGGPAA